MCLVVRPFNGFFSVDISCFLFASLFPLLQHVFLYKTSPLVKCCNSLNYDYTNIGEMHILLIPWAAVTQVSNANQPVLVIKAKNYVMTDHFIWWPHKVWTTYTKISNVGWEQIWKEYWEIIWWSAWIDLTPVWDANLACWSCRFRTYLAWAGFCRWARRPHGSWRGGRLLSPAGVIGRPGNAPRRATSHWSVTRGCWAGAVPGNRAEGSLCRETETMRQRGSGESLYAEAVVESLLKHERLVTRMRRSLFGITLKQALQCFNVSLELNVAA